MEKKYIVIIKQRNGIITRSEFTEDEINEKISWWIKEFEKIEIVKKIGE